MFDRFDTELIGCTLDAEMKQKKEELLIMTNKALEDMRRENGHRILVRLRQTVENETEAMKAKVS